jgi:hypothetical protein
MSHISGNVYLSHASPSLITWPLLEAYSNSLDNQANAKSLSFISLFVLSLDLLVALKHDKWYLASAAIKSEMHSILSNLEISS